GCVVRGGQGGVDADRLGGVASAGDGEGEGRAAGLGPQLVGVGRGNRQHRGVVLDRHRPGGGVDRRTGRWVAEVDGEGLVRLDRHLAYDGDQDVLLRQARREGEPANLRDVVLVVDRLFVLGHV